MAPCPPPAPHSTPHAREDLGQAGEQCGKYSLSLRRPCCFRTRMSTDTQAHPAPASPHQPRSLSWSSGPPLRGAPSGGSLGGSHLGPENDLPWAAHPCPISRAAPHQDRVSKLDQPLPLKPSAEATGMRQGGHFSPTPNSSNRWSLGVAMETLSPASRPEKRSWEKLL